MTQQSSSEAEGEDHEQLISTEKKKTSLRLLRCCEAYQSEDPEKRVTPFAVVILLVLFVIYVLNQADRLVLPVSITAGLRCDASVNSQCNETEPNLTYFDDYVFKDELDYKMYPNLSNKSEEDCIHFNDEEQGLLTGE